jgi:hypothetical protein
MTRWRLLSVITLTLTCAVLIEAKPRIRLGGVTVSAGYVHSSGFYPYFGFPYFYDPLFFQPFFHPGFYTGFAYGPNMGEVRLHTTDKTGAVFLDGAYAGEVSKLKHMWLEPGAYDVEIRNDGRPPFERRVYVLSGKTLDLRPAQGEVGARP